MEKLDLEKVEIAINQAREKYLEGLAQQFQGFPIVDSPHLESGQFVLVVSSDLYQEIIKQSIEYNPIPEGA